MPTRMSRGFLVFELLIALALATLLIPFLTQALVGIAHVERRVDRQMQTQSEWQYMRSFLKRDTESIRQVLDWGKNRLSFIDRTGTLVQYELKGGRVRRHSGKGFHYLTQSSNIDSFDVQNLSTHLLITLAPKEGVTWSVYAKL